MAYYSDVQVAQTVCFPEIVPGQSGSSDIFQRTFGDFLCGIFLQATCPSCHQTDSVKALKGVPEDTEISVQEKCPRFFSPTPYDDDVTCDVSSKVVSSDRVSFCVIT